MLEVKNLIKSYGNEKVLRGVDFSVKKGQTVAIMGPSGCGKSTTIRCLNLLTEPDSGKVIFRGTNLLELSSSELLKLRQEIGFVFQNFNLIERLTVQENVMLPLIKLDFTLEQRVKYARAALEKVRLADQASSYPKQLSGGQKQRVGIARALVIEPSLMLLDEPTASLDPILVKEVLEVIEDATYSQKRAVVLVTHEVSFALKVADIILLLDNGQVVEIGSSESIFTNPQSEVGKKYKELLEYY
ncbi:ABC-type polar amino acid transport system, ATPase component [Halobacteroides halobius DSM 5150]|uniref:ABC-type polar amino acid transport system, ATPase component n=1 Tax=Halobacteroides halobius (strain ATCC 35273 / DSM 5150 / MD-1) TaxID=748449 RepID=L0KAJ3_HALHC|nr:amino acid ABC transporter ATP-binding protein [Halobacteroides halobius]AGB42302.1 ABC-type polar amino acid transport system, ATPase component [Halobacteroides halobius DSM 5150]